MHVKTTPVSPISKPYSGPYTKGFEERIVDAVNESRVDIGEQYGRILEHYLEWLNESVESYCISRQAPTIDLALRADIRILAEFAEAHRPAKEDVAS